MHAGASENSQVYFPSPQQASDLMQGQSYLVKTVLEHYDARNKMFLAFKDSPGNPLSRLHNAGRYHELAEVLAL